MVDLSRAEVLGWQAVKKGLATVGLLLEMPKMVAKRESVLVDSSGRWSTFAPPSWFHIPLSSSSSIPISITLSHTELLTGLRLSLGM